MSYRDLVLHLTIRNAGELSGAVEYAAALSRHCDAHLTGLFTRGRLPLTYHYIPAAVIDEYAAKVQRAATTAHDLFEAAKARHGIAGEWVEVEGGTLETLHHYGRAADLLLVGSTAGGSEEPILGHEYGAEVLRHDLTIGLGRPVLIFPRDVTSGTPAERILIGWNGSKEAARAVHDALPLLKRAQAVSILWVGAGKDDLAKGERLANHLRRHDVAAQFLLRPGDDSEAGDVLLSEAERLQADLIVMGAYGHVRWQEVVFGGATETLLEKARLPVLFSH